MLDCETSARRRRRAALLAAAVLTAFSVSMPARSAAPAEGRAPGARWDHEWARGAVVYEVDVDLKGLIAKLDSLNDGNAKTTTDLGVDALCLRPIFRFPSPTGHDTAAVETLDPAYGSDADFDRLVAEAHRRGMKVLLDLPSDRGGDQPLKAILGRWLARGVDGFRLDATRNLRADHPGPARVDTPQSHAFLRGLAAYVKGIQPQAVLVGYGWTDTPRLAASFGASGGERGGEPGGDELSISLDAPLAVEIVQGAKTGEASAIAAKLAETLRLEPAGAIDAPTLAGADGKPLATRLDGDLGRQKLALAILLTLPGAPFLAAGEETGLAGGAGGANIATVAAEATDPDSLLSHARFVLRARHNSAALAKGDLEILSPTAGSTPILAFVRRLGGERVLVVHNLGAKPVDAGPFAVSGVPDPLFVSPGTPPPHAAAGSLTVRLPPRGSGVWRLR